MEQILFLQVWNIESYECIKQLNAHDDCIWSIVVDGDLLYSGSDDKTIRVCFLTFSQYLSPFGLCVTLWSEKTTVKLGVELVHVLNQSSKVLSVAVGYGLICMGYEGTHPSLLY